MSSICGKLNYKATDAHIEIPILSITKCSNGGLELHPSFTGSEDTQESDGDDRSGCINQNAYQVNKDNETGQSLKLLEEEDNDLMATFQKSFSMTKAKILMPAIKGSREKHGILQKKKNVSWADDVYDPPPSIVSHTRGKKQQQQQQQKRSSKNKENNKKNGKKGQKGNGNFSSSSSSSRGGKDKKSSSRGGGNGNKDGGGYYGSGMFMKTTTTAKVHYSVTA